jgi:hypothetical protein
VNTYGSFSYQPQTLAEFRDGFFNVNTIGKYSCKIKSILDNINGSEGIVLIYSYYIVSGIVPIALALEEMGFDRYGDGVNLFERGKRAYKGSSKGTYIMITGDSRLSPNNLKEYNAAKSAENVDGSKVKIILISSAGSEGLDFKCVRQIHIMEPWYNMNKIEQVIGRGVRNFSHKLLPFKERNVQIFLHGSLLPNDRESVDLYLYRLSEKKAIQIGKITRLLKETAVDCMINSEQINFEAKNFNEPVHQELSSGQVIEFQMGDLPFSANCDYQATCSYHCINTDAVVESPPFDKTFLDKTVDMVSTGILEMFKKNFFYR